MLESPEAGELKFGITSHSGKARLRTHRKAGFTVELQVTRNLPQGSALDAENAVKAALKQAGFEPVRGTEYFDIAATPVVLRTAKSFLGLV